MKSKYILLSLIAVAFLAAGCAKKSVQTPNATPKEETKTDGKKTVQKDHSMSMENMMGVVMKDGKAMSVWPENEIMGLNEEITLKDGNKVGVDGKVTSKDGKTFMLKNGQMISIDGQIKNADMTMMKEEKEETMTSENSMMKQKGTYKDYSLETLALEQKAGHKVVLFFHASWCPNCKQANEDFTNNLNKIPDNVVVLKTDYDTQKELKQKYGVTYQHTFVQVDKNGDMVTKWVSGGINELIQNIK